MTEELVNILTSLSRSSFMWGPFFFSLLFMLVITQKAHLYYQEVILRTDPPAQLEERKVYRRYFVASFVAGIVLVFMSVGWWIYAQLQIHAFEGVIVGLKPYQFITATEDDVYLRAVQREAGPGQQIRDYHFAIVRESPFVAGQVFRFSFYPEPGSIGDAPPEAVSLEVSYSGELTQKYLLSNEEGKFILSRIAD